jgi:hypothetical protein
LASGNPSPSVVNRIEKSFTYLRSKDQLRHYTVGAVITLLLLLTASIVAGFFAKQQFAQARTAKTTADKANLEAKTATRNAEEQKRRAEDAKSKADSANDNAERETKRAQLAEKNAKESIVQARLAKAEADQQKQLADIESKRAEEERIKATIEAENAKGGRLVSTAQALIDDDPSTASLILTETNPSIEPTGGVATARELLNRYVTKLTLRGHGKLYSIQQGLLMLFQHAILFLIVCLSAFTKQSTKTCDTCLCDTVILQHCDCLVPRFFLIGMFKFFAAWSVMVLSA